MLLAGALVAAPSPCRTDEAVALFDARRFSEARRLFEPCAATDASAAIYSGRALIAERELDRAIVTLQGAVALDPKSSDAQYWLGRAYGEKAQIVSVFHQAALAGRIRRAFERSVEIDPSSFDGRFALLEYYLRAPAILGGSMSKARAEASEIRRRDALRGYQAFGRIAEHEKKLDAAAAEYVRAAREFPQNRDPELWLANLAARRKDYGKAFDILEALLRKQPGDAQALFAIGGLGARTGERLDRAEECLRRYLERTPEKDEPPLSGAHYQLGVLCDRKGARDLARAEYRAALALEPTLEAARAALARK